MNDNKLIADFMGVQYKSDEDYIKTLEEMRLHNIGYEQGYMESQLKYHESWNWLMPVVEKIEEDEEIDVNILLNGTRIFKWRTDTDIVNNVAKISFDKKIEHVYHAVVEFIKKYNKES